MTPKEKAKELFDKYMDLEPEYDWEINGINKSLAKQCALIAVDEILNLNKFHSAPNMLSCYNLNYWTEVKKEINEL